MTQEEQRQLCVKQSVLNFRQQIEQRYKDSELKKTGYVFPRINHVESETIDF